MPTKSATNRFDRVLVHVTRLADLFDAPVVEHREPVAEGKGLVLIVCDDDEGDADLALNCLELQLHLLSELEVECSQWFVEQKHSWPPHQGARQGDALTLTARELRGFARSVVVESDHLERLGGTRPPFGLGHAADLHAVLDVLGDGHVREECVLLEDGVDVTASRREFGDVDTAELDGARGGLFEAGDHPEHGGLARPGGAEDREQFAVLDGQVGACHGHDRLSEHLANACEFDLRFAGAGWHGLNRMDPSPPPQRNVWTSWNRDANSTVSAATGAPSPRAALIQM